MISEEGIDEAVAAIEAIGDGEFAAHGSVVALLRFRFFFSGDGHAGDGVLADDDGINGTGKADLNRAADLAAVHSEAHDGTECSDVVEVLAHPFAGCFDFFPAAFAFPGFGLALFFAPFFDGLICFLVSAHEDGFFFDVYVEVWSVFFD